MEPTDINAEAGHIAPLDSDNIPNDNQTHYCFSCEQPMQGLFCNACGQKNDNYRRGIFSLIWELITSVTALEGRIWRTWRSLLLQPGRVAREFANGRRSHWSSPIRVYLAMSILVFAFMGITNTHLIGIDIDVAPMDGINKTESELTAADLDLDISTYWFPRQKEIDARNTSKNFELISRKLNSYIQVDDSFETGENLKPNGLSIEFNNRPIDSPRAVETLIRFSKSPVILTNGFNKWLPRLIFILMPFTILFSAIFIRGRKDAMLYDHLVHAAYIHAVAFLFLFIGIVFSNFIPGSLIFNVLFITLLIYLPLSLKRMFGRGWLKTLWTSYGVGLFYIAFLMTGLISAISLDVGQNLVT